MLVLHNLNSTNQGHQWFSIMEYKCISSKFTLQIQTKYENTQIETCFQVLLP